MSVLLWATLFFGVHSALANCGDAASVRKKITLLKIEATCSSLPLHECALLLKSFSSDMRTIDNLSSGEKCELDLVPLSKPVAKLAETIVEGRIFRELHPNKYVNSPEEFFEHTRLHQERVRLLGSELFRTHPELFKGISPAQLNIILSAHDRAKIASSAISKDGKPFYQKLYEYYGKRAPATLVDELNQADTAYMNEAYKHAGLNDDPQFTGAERSRRKILRGRLKLAERVADLVDRGKSPVAVEEFGRSLKPASSFFTDKEEKKLARELEKNYSRLTTNLSYHPLTTNQKARIARQIMRHETFAVVLRKHGLKKISMRAMTYQALRKGKSGILRAFGKLSTPVAKRILMAADIIGLYFADMNQLGCSGIGYHDWVKDPNCEPAIGLTPKIIEFLNEDFPTQMNYLNTQPTTCQAISKTYQLSAEDPIVRSCSSRLLQLEIGSNLVLVHLDSHKRIKNVDLGELGRESMDHFRGQPEKVDVDSYGNVSKVCYKIGGKETFRTCVNSKSRELTAMNDFMKSINFQIQKSIANCL